MRFVDTNILIYAASREPKDAVKAAICRTLLRESDLALSVQVLQEFYVQATRSSRRDPLSHEQASALIEAFLRFRVQEVTLGIMRAALAASHRFQLSYWDAAIVEAARVLDCAVVLSEDLSHGRDYDGIRVLNPFRPEAR